MFQDSSAEEVGILTERVFLKAGQVVDEQPRLIFPDTEDAPDTILHKRKQGWRLVISKNTGGNDNFNPEVRPKTGRAWAPSLTKRKLSCVLRSCVVREAVCSGSRSTQDSFG